MLLRRLLILAVMLLTGCFPALRPAIGTEGMNRSTAFVARGVLRLTIKWPLVPEQKAFQSQFIPDSTSRVDVTVTNSSNAVVGAGSVVRNSGVASVALDIEVPWANNLSVKAEAFPTSNGPSGNTGAIARGNVSGVNVNANLVNSSVTMASLFLPSITSLGTNANKVGTIVAIFGTNIGSAWPTTPVVKFNAKPALVVTRVNDGQINATVPVGATVGPITINIDGMDASGLANFWPVDTITLAIADHTLFGQSLTGNSRFVGYGGTLNTTTVATFFLALTKTLADYPAPPTITHTTTAGGTYSGSAPVLTDTTSTTDSVFSAASNHRSGTLTVALGFAPAQRSAESIGIDSVTISPVSQTLNVVKPAAQAALPDLPGVVTAKEFTATVNHSIAADFPTATGINWSLSGIGDKLLFSNSQTDGVPSAGVMTSRITVTTDETAAAASDGKVTATAKIGSAAQTNKAEAAITTTTTGQVDATAE